MPLHIEKLPAGLGHVATPTLWEMCPGILSVPGHSCPHHPVDRGTLVFCGSSVGGLLLFFLSPLSPSEPGTPWTSRQVLPLLLDVGVRNISD